MRIPTILLIDNNESDAETVKRAFQQHRLANLLIHAPNGLVALEMLRGKVRGGPLPKPYIILLDINLPRMSGLAFLRELRQDPGLKASVVFVLTTSDNQQDKFDAYAEHVAGYMLKQNVGHDFVNAIRLIDSYQTLVILPD